MNEEIYAPALVLGLAAWLGWELVQGFRSDTMHWGYAAFHVSGNRRTEPGKFWLAAVLKALFFSLLLLVALTSFFFPRGIGG